MCVRGCASVHKENHEWLERLWLPGCGKEEGMRLIALLPERRRPGEEGRSPAGCCLGSGHQPGSSWGYPGWQA